MGFMESYNRLNEKEEVDPQIIKERDNWLKQI